MSVANAKKDLDSSIDVHAKWKCEFLWETDFELLEYCRDVSSPVLEYYKKLFQDEDGDNYHMRQSAMACKLFDPLYLKGKENQIHTLCFLADQLHHFRYPQFNATFISQLKREIPLAVSHAIQLSSQFKIRMQRRKKRHNLEDDAVLDCRDDPGERARMVWEWWKVRLMSDDNLFPVFRMSLRLVVLTQTSSCAVERVFSRLKMIRDACGDNKYEDMTEIRVLIQCNGDLDDLLT